MADAQLQQLGRDVWANKPLLIAIVGALALVVFVLTRNSQQATTTTPPPQPTLPNAGGGTYVEESYTNYAPVTTTVPAAPVATGTPVSTSAPTSGAPVAVYKMIQAVQSGALANKPAGTNVGGKNIGIVPKGATLSLLGGPSTVSVKGIVNHYYQVIYNGVTGWVNAKTIGY